MTADSKVVVVVGATGKQGGSVARSLLQNKNFQVRCITRSPTSAKAKELARLGAEICQADGFNEADLLRAFNGGWGAFVNTNSEDPVCSSLELASNGRTDEELGKNIVRCAALAGVQHLVYSSGAPSHELTNGVVHIPGLDMKAKVEQFARATPAFQTVTPIIAAWFMENMLEAEYADLFGGFPLSQDSNGYLTYKTPFWSLKEDFPWISIADDFGDLVHGILLQPLRWNHRVVQAVGAITSSAEVVNTFASVTGKKARFIPLVDPFEMKTLSTHWREQERDAFIFSQLRDGEFFGNGPTETETATALKKAAFEAKGRQGSATLMTVREFFQREFT
ncbi:hypothetical protein CNMCM6069_006536 [Aspergillus lentulus]|nr:hypothetical protein CNMCM6069_006536 [Aspergillus lentulus]